MKPMPHQRRNTTISQRQRGRLVSLPDVRRARSASDSSSRPARPYAWQAGDDLVAPALEQALLHSEQRILALEEDRRRISRDLHDTVLQSLYAVGLQLRAAQAVAQEAPHLAVEQLNQIGQHLNAAVAEVRTFLAQDTPPPPLDPKDLDPSLRTLMDAMLKGSSVQGHLTIDPAASRLLRADDMRDILHLTREIISNCLRHAEATELVLRIERVADAFLLSARDNGVGFRWHQARAKGCGLANMAARAERLGGQIHIVSAPGKGTEVCLELPPRTE